ncbi:MAG: hypothetical protein MUC92_08960 [Fimbriimonadaceae bacterium]|jgi:hypothetical protein|nr:hypothetical protein [Fimbriimonadaceae bacterium]
MAWLEKEDPGRGYGVDSDPKLPASVEGYEPKPKRHPTVQKCLDYANPKYHWSQIKHDLDSMKQAMANRHAVLEGEHTVPLDRVFRGKLFGAFFLSGPSNILGVVLGYGLQRFFHNQWVGLFGTILVCFLITAIAYQIVWFLDNRRLYRKVSDNPLIAFREMQRDLAPVHRTALNFALGFGLITIPINALIVGIMTLVNDDFAKIVPVGGIMMIVEALFVSGAFVRVMGDFYEKYSVKLAEKYQDTFAMKG